MPRERFGGALSTISWQTSTNEGAPLEQHQENPFAAQLATHKLKGHLAGVWACSAGYDLRILFEFVRNPDRDEEDVFLLDIGTHDEVY